MSKSKHKFILFLFLVLTGGRAFAVPLQNADLSADEKIGVLIATFDPPSLQHDSIIRHALEQGRFEKLVVMPTDFTPHKLYRTQTHLRHEMLAAAYANDPQVLTTASFEFRYPQSRSLIFELQNHYNVQVSAVILAEDLKSRVNRLIIPWLLPADDSMIIDGNSIATWGSSSAIRKYFANHPDFFDLSEDEIANISREELPVDLAVRKIIWKEKLYDQNTNLYRFGFIKDWVWSNISNWY